MSRVLLIEFTGRRQWILPLLITGMTGWILCSWTRLAATKAHPITPLPPGSALALEDQHEAATFPDAVPWSLICNRSKTSAILEVWSVKSCPFFSAKRCREFGVKFW